MSNINDDVEAKTVANNARKPQGREFLTVPPGVQTFFVQLLTATGKRSDYFKTCLTCIHWKRAKEEVEGNHCAKFNAMPPPEVIVDGCQEYEDFDGIPF